MALSEANGLIVCYTLDQPAAVTVHAMALVLAVHLQYLTISILD